MSQKGQGRSPSPGQDLLWNQSVLAEVGEGVGGTRQTTVLHERGVCALGPGPGVYVRPTVLSPVWPGSESNT